MSVLLQLQLQVFEAIEERNNSEIARTLTAVGIKANKQNVSSWRLGTKKLSDTRLEEIANLYNIKIKFEVQKDCIL